MRWRGQKVKSLIERFILFVHNRMIKKNISERRFNTAAARIMLSSKLPSDFFLPSREKEDRDSSLWSQRHQDAEAHHEHPKKDALLFTFHRSRSQQKFKSNKSHWPSDSSNSSPAPKLFASVNHKKAQTKLPPVSVAGVKENINANWFKDFSGNKDKLKKLARISNRILHEGVTRDSFSQVVR